MGGPDAHDPARTGPDRTDLIAGLAVIAMSAAFAWVAWGYGIGRVRQMGAGFFPFALGLLGCGLGAAIVARAVLLPAPRPVVLQLRRLAFVCAAFVIFGLGIERAGLPLTVLVATIVGSLADRTSKLHESVLLGLGLAAGIWLLFVVLLGLTIPVLPFQR